MSDNENCENTTDLPSLTPEEILDLLENDELTAEMKDYLLIQYKDTIEGISETSVTNEPYPIGGKCAITFSFGDYMVLLPALVLGYSNNAAIRVLILTPVTFDTIPCHDYFGKKQSCGASACPYSHGYELPTEFVVPFQALGIDDIETLQGQLQYGKKVWCKEQHSPADSLWKLGSIVDQLHGPSWRVRLRDGKHRKRINVGADCIMPFKNILSDDKESESGNEEWSEESDSESAVTRDRSEEGEYEEDKEEVEVYFNNTPIDKKWGAWQAHTTGFAPKMMKKMGYVPGKGLGVDGQGCVEPVHATPYSGSKSKGYSHISSRPGLGMQQSNSNLKNPKEKKTRNVNATEKKEKNSMFELMDSLTGSSIKKGNRQGATTSVNKSLASNIKIEKPKDARQAHQLLAKLQSKLDSAEAKYIDATEAYRRNKDSPMKKQFGDRLKIATDNFKALTDQMIDLKGHIKRSKDKQNMYTF